MVNTGRTEMTGSSGTTVTMNQVSVAENVSGEGRISQPVVETPVDGQIKDNVKVPAQEIENKCPEEFPGKEETEKPTEVDNNDENIFVSDMNNENKAKSDQKNSEDDETDDQEDLMWDDEDEFSEEDSEENFGDGVGASAGDSGKEEDDEEEDEVSADEEEEEERGGGGGEEEEEEEDEYEVGSYKALEVAEGGEMEANVEADKTEANAEADKTEANAEADKTVANAEADKTEANAEADKTEANAEADKLEAKKIGNRRKVESKDDKRKAKAIEDEMKSTAKRKEREAKVRQNGKEANDNRNDKLAANLKDGKESNGRSKKKVQSAMSKKVDPKDKAESSQKRKVKKRVESMGMIFMCSSKTKNDCYRYRVLGLPESKKDIVEKIYTGMRLFLYDVDQKLLYGIYKAAGPGGYNIEPKAFKSQFPAQVRFTVLDDCSPLPEEMFKKVIKDNYFTKTKFDCQLKAEQVKKLCKLFAISSKGHHLLQTKPGGSHRRLEPKARPLPKKRNKRAVRLDEEYRERAHKRLRKALVSSPLPSSRAPHPYYPYRRNSPTHIDTYAYSYRDSAVVMRRRDPYLEGRDSYYREMEARDTYRYPSYGSSYNTEQRDPYRYTSYGGGTGTGTYPLLLSDSRDNMYLEGRGDVFSFDRPEIGGWDSFVSTRQRPMYGDPGEYSYREYRL